MQKQLKLYKQHLLSGLSIWFWTTMLLFITTCTLLSNNDIPFRLAIILFFSIIFGFLFSLWDINNCDDFYNKAL